MDYNDNDKFIKQMLEDKEQGRLSRGGISALQMLKGGKKKFHTHDNRKKFTAYELSNFIWSADVKDFVQILVKAGVARFVYTNTSGALMDNLHLSEQEGCWIQDLVVAEKDTFGDGKRGIEIEVPNW